MISLHIDEQRGWRGGEQQASYLVQGLVERGHTAILAGRKDTPFLTRDHGGAPFSRHAMPFNGEWDPVTAWQLARLVQRHRVDILHAHTSHAHTLACIARKLAGRGKVIVSRRVDFPPKPHAFSRWKYGWPDHYIAISGTIAEVLRNHGIPDDKLTVVHSAINPERFQVAPIPREHLGIPDGAPLVGIVAALVGHKDLPTFVQAMETVNAQRPEAHAVIVGEGPARGGLEEQIRAAGLEECVHLLGFRDDVPSILRALDVFALSSKEEGLGTSILDAMAAGIPVAATAGGGIPEMIAPGETGLLAPVGDGAALGEAILTLLNEPDAAAAMAGNARTLVNERFTLPRMVKGNIAVYERVLDIS